MAYCSKEDAIEELIGRHASRLGDGAVAFLRRVYSKDTGVYRQRLLAHGFSGCARVLDAGCGFGQWTLALAQLNAEVHALDIVPERVDFVRDLVQGVGAANVRVDRGSLTDTPFADAHFDAIFCYGVLFLTRWRDTLREFRRVLRPRGLLYVNANGPGWYRFLARTGHNAAADYDPRLLESRVLRNTANYKRGLPTEPGLDILIEPRELEADLGALGFADLKRGAEGTVRARGGEEAFPPPFFRGEYEEGLGVYEVIATK